jgi:hypothetical protein
MRKPEKIVTPKTNLTHKPLNENTICFDQIVVRLSSYTPANFQQLSLRKFHLSEKLTSLENHHQKPSNTNQKSSNAHQQLQTIITFDPLKEI